MIEVINVLTVVVDVARISHPETKEVLVVVHEPVIHETRGWGVSN